MSSVISVDIHSNLSEFPTQKRYDPSIKILDLKKKLELITGANYASMKITLSINDNIVGELDKDEETLGHYVSEQVGNGSIIKLVVKDEQPSDLLNGDVPKYTISKEKYLERPNNVRNFIKETREKQAAGQ